MKKQVKKVKQVKKHKKHIRKNEAEKILEQFKESCLAKKEEREGYQISLKSAHKRVGKIHSITMANRFLIDITKVILDNRLRECFQYGQAYYHLKEMVEDKIAEMEKIRNGGKEIEEA